MLYYDTRQKSGFINKKCSCKSHLNGCRAVGLHLNHVYSITMIINFIETINAVVGYTKKKPLTFEKQP